MIIKKYILLTSNWLTNYCLIITQFRKFDNHWMKTIQPKKESSRFEELQLALLSEVVKKSIMLKQLQRFCD